MNIGNIFSEHITFQGWAAVRLTNDLLELIAVPELGGRVMSLRLGAYQFLFTNPDLLGKRFTPEEHAGDGSLTAWKNYGGEKTWPAPQGWERADQWPGPPDPVLDSGHYQIALIQEGELAMTSPPDARTGLQIRRKITIVPGTSQVRLDLSFENISKQAVRWSIWDVMQLDCSRLLADGTRGLNDQCWLYIPTETKSPYTIQYGTENPQWKAEIAPGLLAIQYLGHVGKIGVDSRAGWLAFANQLSGYVLAIRFPYEEGAEYPDNNASVECWTESPGAPSPVPIRSPGFLLEAEVLGALHTLQLGAQTHLSITWALAHCPGPIYAVNEIGCVHQPLSVQVENGWARLQGVFGCFEVGHVELDWHNQDGQIQQQIVLLPVSPLSVLSIDQVLPLPDHAVRAALIIYRADGTLAGELASAEVTRIGS